MLGIPNDEIKATLKNVDKTLERVDHALAISEGVMLNVNELLRVGTDILSDLRGVTKMFREKLEKV
jgi:hypothetical protein